MILDPTPFVGKFTQEARELIQRLNDHLMALEQSPDNRDTVRELLRTVHTLKGSAKILRFLTISRIAHKIEDVLGGLYEERLAPSANLVELLFAGADALLRGVDAVGRQQSDAIDCAAIEALLERAGRGEHVDCVPRRPSDDGAPPASHACADEPEQRPTEPAPPLTPPSPVREPDVIRIDVGSLDNVIRLVSELAVSHRKAEHEFQGLTDLLRLTRKLASHAQHSPPRPGDDEPDAGRNAAPARESQACVALVERLLTAHRDETAYRDLLLNELSDTALTMRMLPLATVFRTFPRAVRDLARHVGKQVDFRMYGEETTLDKKIIEKLGTPLMHLLRNSLDHGIEPPEERVANGKPAAGRLIIQASQRSGHIEIVLRDDGRGIPTAKLRRRLIARGLFSEEQARRLDAAELRAAIFLPGVSTSDMITDISGRGFGMDIVKTEIEHLKGSITLTSEPGQGTCCVLTLPVTLTTVRCLTIAVRGRRFAVPIESLEETVYVAPDDCIRVVNHQAIRLRDQMIRILPLADALALPGVAAMPAAKMFVLVAHAAGTRVGLIVDDILDEQDVVQKPLPAHLQHLKTVSGAAIAGDNTVVLILHVPEIVRLAGHTTRARQTPAERTGAPPSGRPRILLVEDSTNTADIERAILEARGYATEIVADGLQALERARQTAYDLIVTDVEMPGLDGFRLTEQLRRLPNYARVPIVIVTSLDRAADQRRGLEAGANAYITKGDFEQSRLADTVASLLDGFAANV